MLHTLYIDASCYEFLLVKCPMSLTSFSWFSDNLKKSSDFCNVKFSLIISNRITVFGKPVNVYLARFLCLSDSFLIDLDLISWIVEQGYVLVVKSISRIL